MIFYFSGVGNSAWVARKLADALQDEVKPIADEIRTDMKYALSPDEAVGFVFPVYGWEPPMIVLDFIRKMEMSTPTYLYFVCTCGDDTGKTGKIFTQAIQAKGWTCQAGYSITMPDTYVCLPGFDIDGEDELKLKMDNASARVDYIISELKQRLVHHSYNCLEGAFPYVKTYILGGLLRCPVHNIKVDGKPQWGTECTMCLACYHVCPHHAIEYGKRTKGKGQYSI